MKETKEPLAKFQARVNKDNRVTIPRPILEAFGLKQNDYVKVLIRKIEISDKTVAVIAQALLAVKIGKYGAITLPKKLVKEFELKENEPVEVIILDYYKFEELVSEKGRELLSKLQSRNNYWILPTDSQYLSEIGIKYKYLF
ncbi:AbrB/MazE/SpoVT family DNA-binding domain-containing protein [Thermococcus sp. JCM 11816]|uniref:AbrB/MazE/SpoVT family DNA-binding domain-containing protein n=1 Tax=Thermococcus sp. (strain JCM 11816 / KS-1) TaxID=1295125 RepID=UPI0006D07ECE